MAVRSSTSAAAVRLDVRVGSSRETTYEVGDGGFLVGSVPGCDLRLPGTGLAPVVGLVARRPEGAVFRKLAPLMPVTINGKPAASVYLNDGDRIALGAAELVVRISGAAEGGAPVDDRRRGELEAECARLQRRVEELSRRPAETETSRPVEGEDELRRKSRELEERGRELIRQELELGNLRREAAALREELVAKNAERKEKYLQRKEGVRVAGEKLQAQKHSQDAREAALAEAEQSLAARAADLDARALSFREDRRRLEELARQVDARRADQQRELGEKNAELQRREAALADETAALHAGQAQYRADLVRLDRERVALEQRLRAAEAREAEVEGKFAALARDTSDLEEQAARMDEWHQRLTAESARLAEQKKAQDATTSQAEQRSGALEAQQTMLATLRTRVERMREELRRQEQALTEQRSQQESAEAELSARLEEARQARLEVENDRTLFESERVRFEERRATLEQAVAQLRQAQAALAAEQAELQQRAQGVEGAAKDYGEQAGELMSRAEQLDQVARKVEADREAMAQKEAALARSERTLAALQDQVRRRNEELDRRQEALAAAESAAQSQTSGERERLAAAERLRAEAERELAALRDELDARAAEVEARAAELARREAVAAGERAKLDQEELRLAGQRQELVTERMTWEVEKRGVGEKERATREELTRLRDEAGAAARQVPELELRAEAAVERLARGREQLREHLAEINTYARQSREDMDVARREIREEAENVRRAEEELHAGRDEHRLAVLAFRQQLIEWQGTVAEMRQALTVGTSALELKRAAVEEQAREVADNTARLAHESEALRLERKQVAARRDEVDRHLGEMREWYRKKLREVVGTDTAHAAESRDLDARNPRHAVLDRDEPRDEADEILGTLLTNLGLVEADTLAALFDEAARQRRSLRQLLLAGGYLTLYQMALIEAGNLDGLMLGPVRVIDKLASSPREAVYRVFDPRTGSECVLRHLAEAEMHDAVRPDEFAQRFAAAASLRHGNIAEVREVLTIAGRPAALAEFVQGAPGQEWSGLAAAPGVWYRLVCQAALALHATHAAGLAHGHVDESAFVLTADGTLKLVGLGEPAWLHGGDGDESPAADLLALGAVAEAWATPGEHAPKTRGKVFPNELRAIVDRLRVGDFDSAQSLLEELETAGATVPASGAAWERLLRQVREQSPPALRKSA